MEKGEHTTMKVSRKFLKYLDKQIVHKSESYEDIIKRLLREKSISQETKQEVGSEYEQSL
jgi:negative regulator of replication initiation